MSLDDFDSIDHRADCIQGYKLKVQKDAGVPCSEVQKIVSKLVHNTPETFTPFCENLFTILATVVVSHVTTSGVQATEHAQNAMYRQVFFEQMKVAGMDSYLHDMLFSELPEYFKYEEGVGLQWPNFFMKYVNELMNRELTLTQMNRKPATKKYTKTQGFNYNFSEKVKAVAHEARREINNRLSTLWRDKLGSGETKSGLFDLIRGTTKKRDMYLKAKAAFHRTQAFTSAKNRSGERYETAVNGKFEERFNKESDVDHFPHYWLVFCLYAQPGEEKFRLPIFQVDNISKLQEKVISINDEVAINQYSRRFINSNKAKNELAALKAEKVSNTKPPLSGQSRSPSPGSSVGSSKNHLEVTHHIIADDYTKPFDFNTQKEKKLEEVIQFLRDVGKDSNGDYKRQVEIEKYTDQLVKLKLEGYEKLI